MKKHKGVYFQRGDDYLIEAQRVCGEDKREYDKPTPRCPYCGGEMEKRVFSDYGILRFWCCPKCRATSPWANTAEDAYAAAMQRCVEPNRVLTLEEVKEQRAVWLEDKASEPELAFFRLSAYPHHSVFTEGIIETNLTNDDVYCDNKDYGKYWRCWLRKPTREEMEGTPWMNQ